VRASLLRAEKALRSAMLLEKSGEFEDAVSRAYYAIFHAARAFLFSKGLKAKTHRGTISLFDQQAVKKGVLNKKFADMFRKAFDLRQKGDYELHAELNKELVRETIKTRKNLSIK
jgi:hypothetical protein